MNLDKLLLEIEYKLTSQPEFAQAVREVLESIADVYEQNPKFEDHGIIQRLINPDKIYIFKVPWTDDKGAVQINIGYRIQFNNALGPYKGGLRFHPSVNLSILKFLAFEQIFKNSLTTLPLGAAKGGSDFNPKGKSEREIMRFCQAYMLELWKEIGPETDVPAGDIGVGSKEIGYMFGMYKKLTSKHSGILTGKGIDWGGTLMRPQATGFGCVYFTQEMLKTQGHSLKGKTVSLSGFGTVAWGAAKKITELGGKVITISGPDGYIYFEEGFDDEKIDYMLELRATNQDIVKPFSYEFPETQFHENKRPWEQKTDIAIPCATQNELDKNDAMQLIENGCICLTEGSNMPCTPDAIEILQDEKILFAPGKAANAGGVATSVMEMTQNAMKTTLSKENIDLRLYEVMTNIHNVCVKYGKTNTDYIDYVKGANIAGFLRVANAMIDQGIL